MYYLVGEWVIGIVYSLIVGVWVCGCVHLYVIMVHHDITDMIMVMIMLIGILDMLDTANGS